MIVAGLDVDIGDIVRMSVTDFRSLQQCIVVGEIVDFFENCGFFLKTEYMPPMVYTQNNIQRIEIVRHLSDVPLLINI